MRKVVLNSCFGGFSLSSLALKRYYDLTHNNEKYFVYCGKFEEDMPFGIQHYVLVKDDKDLDNIYEDIIVSKNNVGDDFYKLLFDINEIDDKEEYTLEQINDIEEKYKSLDFGGEIEYVYSCDIERHDPILIQVVEELGEKADGACADLNIVEIDDNDEYYIDEYDGMESIELKSQAYNKNWK